MANYNLTVERVYGIGPGGGRVMFAAVGDALFVAICEHGHENLVAGILGGGLPLESLVALPADALFWDALSTGCSIGADYGDLSVSDLDSTRSVYLSDPSFTAADPVPAFRTWCEGLGGTYADET